MQTFLTTTRRRAILLTKTTIPISYTLYYHTHNYLHHSTMCTNTTIPYQSSHTFTCNPLKTPTPNDPLSPFSSLETLKSHLFTHTHDPISPIFKVLPFRKGRPLVGMSQNSILGPNWHLGWLGLTEIRALLSQNEVGLSESRVLLSQNDVGLSVDKFVYLGSKPEEDCVFWGVDVSKDDGLVDELGKKELSFVELRTLMIATDWSDAFAMGQLSIAGHARALLEWHGLSRFCGHCGCKTVPMEAGRRMHCSNELCKKRIYPRVDPVVIMLVIDRENDRALLGRQSRFVPRMWSCLAGFLEAGESLEEAVRRETWEETGIEVGEVIYHSSQPWPVGPSSMPCQLMVGFFAYAKSLEISVDKEELEDAQWHSREDVKKALSAIEYKKAQRTAASKVDQICKGVKPSQSLSSNFNNESGELPSMFVPGPFAIAHHLISSWAFQRSVSGGSTSETRLSSPVSNL